MVPMHIGGKHPYVRKVLYMVAFLLLLLPHNPCLSSAAVRMSVRGILAYGSLKQGMSEEQVQQTIGNDILRTGFGAEIAGGRTYRNTNYHFSLIDVNVVMENGKVYKVRIKSPGDNPTAPDSAEAFFDFLQRLKSPP